MTAEPQLIEVPENDGSNVYEQLGYVQACDAVLQCYYAFVAYKETERSSGAWRVRIKSSQTTGVVFEPKMIADKALAASEQGHAFFTWGAGMEPSQGDPRWIEYRVYVANGKPSEIEVVARMRKADQTASEMSSVKFKWPA